MSWIDDPIFRVYNVPAPEKWFAVSEREHKALVAERDRFKAEVEKLKLDNAHLAAARDEAIAATERELERRHKAEKALGDTQHSLGWVRAERDDLRAQNEKLSKQVLSHSSERNAYRTEVVSLRKCCDEYCGKLNAKQNEIDVLKRKYEASQRERYDLGCPGEAGPSIRVDRNYLTNTMDVDVKVPRNANLTVRTF